MVIIVIAFLLMAVHGIMVVYGRKCQDRMGHNIGKKYMKEEWGIEEERFYHE
jgi:hypothetical protein